MLGILEDLPEPRVITPGLLTAQIKFRDTGPAQYALTATPPQSEIRNPQSEIQTFPFEPDWGNEISAGGTKCE
jgi:hypothetical protein